MTARDTAYAYLLEIDPSLRVSGAGVRWTDPATGETHREGLRYLDVLGAALQAADLEDPEDRSGAQWVAYCETGVYI